MTYHDENEENCTACEHSAVVHDGTTLQSHRQLHVMRALQADKYMQQDGRKNIYCDDVGWQTEASPMHSDVDVTVTVEVLRPIEDMKVPSCMNDHEENEDDRTPCKANSVFIVSVDCIALVRTLPQTVKENDCPLLAGVAIDLPHLTETILIEIVAHPGNHIRHDSG